MPDSLLTILKFCLLAGLYLFFFRVLRAVWTEVKGPPLRTMAAMSPTAAPARGGQRLRIIEPEADRGRSFDLADELVVGRAGGCGVVVNDSFASQLHARVFRRDGTLFIEDLGSTNGTYLNRQKVTQPVPVRRGDRIQIGQTVLELT